MSKCSLLSFAAAIVIATMSSAQVPTDVGSEFNDRVNAYMALRQQAREGVAPEHIIDPRIRSISGALLAARLRDARARALPGDVFPSPFSEMVRDGLRRAFDEMEIDVMLTDLYPDGVPDPGTARINTSYSDRVAVGVPTAVLSILLPLPPVLGYRLIGRDIALWDEEARLVVDLIADALPEPGIWRFTEVRPAELRQRVHDALRASGLDAWRLLQEMAADGSGGAWRPLMGDVFPWEIGNMMPPSLLRALPELSSPLEYRLLGPDLVVIDIRTGVILAVLHGLLPASSASSYRVREA